MVILESLKDIRDAKVEDVGSKAKALAELAEQGFRVPTAVCIPTAGYEAYMTGTSLRDRVLFELGRNPNRADEVLIEAVYGLNAGLVDGTVEPDRWTLKPPRTSGPGIAA